MLKQIKQTFTEDVERKFLKDNDVTNIKKENYQMRR